MEFAFQTQNSQLHRKEMEEMDFTSSKYPEYQYKTEFQSHEPEVVFIFKT